MGIGPSIVEVVEQVFRPNAVTRGMSSFVHVSMMEQNSGWSGSRKKYPVKTVMSNLGLKLGPGKNRKEGKKKKEKRRRKNRASSIDLRRMFPHNMLRSDPQSFSPHPTN